MAIIDKVKQSFLDIDYKYLVLRKEQSMINRVDIACINDCEYSDYGKFII